MRRYPRLNLNDPINQGLVGYWSMDYPTLKGTSVFDLSGNGNTGTTVNSPTAAVGKLGQALLFNGSTQYLNMGSVGDFTTSNFTLSGWFYITALNGSHQPVIFFKGPFNVQGYYVQLASAGTVAFNTNGPTTQSSVSSAGAITTNQWYLITLVRNGVSCRTYVNGIDKTNTDPTHSNPISSANAFNIGTYANQTGNTLQLQGYADDVRIYNRALSPVEAYRLYSDTTGQLGLIVPRRPIVGSSVSGTAIQIDWGTPFDSIFSLQTDRLIPVESLVNERVNWLLPEESSQSISKDHPLSLESLRAIRTDRSSPIEFLSTTRDDQPIPLEALTAIRDDVPLPNEWLTSAQTDLSTPTEWLLSAGVDWLLPIEWLGSTIALQIDATITIEWSTNSQANGLLPIESLTDYRVDWQTPLEQTQGVQTDGVAPVESAISLRADRLLPIEWLGSAIAVQGDSSQPIEWSLLARTDASSPAERLASPRADNVAPVEWLGASISIQGDSSQPIEWLASSWIDLLSPAERLTSLRSATSVPIEWLGVSVSGVLSDWLMPMEWVVSQARPSLFTSSPRRTITARAEPRALMPTSQSRRIIPD